MLACMQGARDYQEDTVACITSPVGLAGGVFDGHGGDDISKELERVLLQVRGQGNGGKARGGTAFAKASAWVRHVHGHWFATLVLPGVCWSVVISWR